MKQNKELIRELRSGTKSLRNKLGVARKTKANIIPGKSSGNELEQNAKSVEKHLSMLRKNLDTVKSKVMEKRLDLTKQRDKAMELERAHQDRQSSGQNHHTNRIRSLENQLDKALVNYNEAKGIRTTYEQIIERLQNDRVNYDNKLSSLDRTTKAKSQDYEDLKNLQVDAIHARDLAIQQRDQRKRLTESSRLLNKKSLQEKRMMRHAMSDMVESATRMNEINKGPEQVKASLQEAASSDALKQTLAGMNFSKQQVSAKEAALKDSVTTYELALEKIRKFTGIIEVAEIDEKFRSQQNTKDNLYDITTQNEGKIQSKTEQIAGLLKQVEVAKYSGINARGTSRKAFDEVEDR